MVINIRSRPLSEMSEEEINQLRLLWRQELKENLEFIASIDMQRRTWIDLAFPDIIWDWSEMIAGYFDDLNMDESTQGIPSGLYQHVEARNLSKQEADMLKPFNSLFDSYIDRWVGNKYPTPKDLENILKDPKWIKITKMAGKILKKIDFSKLPDEK